MWEINVHFETARCSLSDSLTMPGLVDAKGESIVFSFDILYLN
jgi:hypothetical protein